MRIKFLQTVPSFNPHCPFQAGQTIEVDKPTADISAALVDGRAIVLTEPAAVGVPEVAVMPRAKGRKVH